ncbi:MAG: hypothetical protein AAF600_20115 [Bacteroidota bacterium]
MKNSRIISEEINNIPIGQKRMLSEMISYLQHQLRPRLHFICTRNSGRSHLSQIWAHTLAYSYKFEVETFSNGTEATAFHPNAVATSRKSHF